MGDNYMEGIVIEKNIILVKDMLVEPPVLLKSGTYEIANVGAFTYFNGSIFSRNVKSVGRYCSIAPDVILGHFAHPTNTLSHHNVFFGVGEWMSGFHNYKNDIMDMSKLIKKSGAIEIGNDVWIGARAFIMNGVKVGDGAIIAADSMVTHDVPPFAVVGGNPAKIIKYRYPAKIINRLLELRWWDYGPEILSDLDLTDINSCIIKIHERIQNGAKKYTGKGKYIIQKGTLKINSCKG